MIKALASATLACASLLGPVDYQTQPTRTYGAWTLSCGARTSCRITQKQQDKVLPDQIFIRVTVTRDGTSLNLTVETPPLFNKSAPATIDRQGRLTLKDATCDSQSCRFDTRLNYEESEAFLAGSFLNIELLTKTGPRREVIDLDKIADAVRALPYEF